MGRKWSFSRIKCGPLIGTLESITTRFKKLKPVQKLQSIRSHCGTLGKLPLVDALRCYDHCPQAVAALPPRNKRLVAPTWRGLLRRAAIAVFAVHVAVAVVLASAVRVRTVLVVAATASCKFHGGCARMVAQRPVQAPNRRNSERQNLWRRVTLRQQCLSACVATVGDTPSSHQVEKQHGENHWWLRCSANGHPVPLTWCGLL